MITQYNTCTQFSENRCQWAENQITENQLQVQMVIDLTNVKCVHQNTLCWIISFIMYILPLKIILK